MNPKRVLLSGRYYRRIKVPFFAAYFYSFRYALTVIPYTRGSLLLLFLPSSSWPQSLLCLKSPRTMTDRIRRDRPRNGYDPSWDTFLFAYLFHSHGICCCMERHHKLKFLFLHNLLFLLCKLVYGADGCLYLFICIIMAKAEPHRPLLFRSRASCISGAQCPPGLVEIS